jgi:lipoyl(octanoyl) transferase
MDQPTLLSKFHELSNNLGEFDQPREDLLIFKKFNWYYNQTLEFQKLCHEFIQENPEKRVLILCNHPTCFTMGRGLQKKAGKVIEGLVPTEETGNLPFPCYKINRGGGLTYHYPGQLIIYPILKLGGKNPSLSELSDLLFDPIIIAAEEALGLKLSKKRGDLIGLWTEEPGSLKVASFGIGIERFITQHGIAVNIEDGEIFNWLSKMHPCGLQGSTYSFFNKVSDKESSVEALASAFLNYSAL